MYTESEIFAQALVIYQKGLTNFSSTDAILYLLNNDELALHLATQEHAEIFKVNIADIKQVKKALSLLVIYLKDGSHHQINFDTSPNATNVTSLLGSIGLTIALFKTETSGVHWWYHMLKSKGVKSGGVIKQFIRALLITFLSIFAVVIIVGIYAAFTAA